MSNQVLPIRRICEGSYETLDGVWELRRVPKGEPEAGRWIARSGMYFGDSQKTLAECRAALFLYLLRIDAITS